MDDLLNVDEELVGKFKLGSHKGPQPVLLIRVLVSNEPGVALPPIIGCSVIEHLVKSGIEQYPEATPTVVREA